MTADTYPIRYYESQKKKLKIKPPKWEWVGVIIFVCAIVYLAYLMITA